MNRFVKFVAMIACNGFAMCALAQSQQTPPTQSAEPPTIASTMDIELQYVESQIVPVAEAMPADKYSFQPANGEYKSVRTFALEVKHIATANYAFWSLILGQAPPPGVSLAGATNGPDDIQTKDQIVKYLKDSFVLGHKAMASLTMENANIPLPNPPGPFMKTRLADAAFALAHSMDHFGQMVEYLRMNGIVPPPSQGQPAANPSKE